MAKATIDLTCPQCGGTMEFHEEKHELLCPYCNHTALVEEEEDAQAESERIMSKAYAYRAGVLRAEEEAQKKKAKKKKLRRAAIILCVILLLAGCVTYTLHSIPAANPFDYITVEFSGTTGNGEATIIINSEADGEASPDEIQYSVSPQRYLSEGDRVTVSASSDAYRLSPTKKSYTVKGLDLYLTDLDSLSDKALTMIHNKSDILASRAAQSGGASPALQSLAPAMIYLATDGKDSNTLYDVYRASFTEADGSANERFIVIYYTNIVVRDTEEPTMQYDATMYTGHIIETLDHSYGGYITGYKNLKDVKADILSHQNTAVKLKERQQ